MIKLSPNFMLNVRNPTKRSILSSLAKIFDPLGFVLPVTVTGKVLMRNLWLRKFDWDTPLDNDDVIIWNKLCSDLDNLKNLEFNRKAYNDSDNLDLFIFCDASKQMYGFVSYMRKTGESISNKFLFAKARSSPLKTKTLPTLELMSVFLAFKCLESILTSVAANIGKVFVCVDAQIVLSWILSKKIKSKNVFASNRVNDISNISKILEEKFSVKFIFKYIPISKNPADLLTRGISFSEFGKNMTFWLSGPEFLHSHFIEWEENSLGCLSNQSKLLT